MGFHKGFTHLIKGCLSLIKLQVSYWSFVCQNSSVYIGKVRFLYDIKVNPKQTLPSSKFSSIVWHESHEDTSLFLALLPLFKVRFVEPWALWSNLQLRQLSEWHRKLPTFWGTCISRHKKSSLRWDILPPPNRSMLKRTAHDWFHRYCILSF